MKSELVLIYFEGCPNAKVLREALRRHSHSFREILQDDLQKDSPWLHFSSPSVLRGEELLFGERLKVGTEGSCTFSGNLNAEMEKVLGRV